MATTDPGSGSRKWLRRFGWLLALWLASVGCLFAVALIFRWLMRAVGLTAP